jgi:prepilin-type N-terminal cleavage/methylation domain-containing protein
VNYTFRTHNQEGFSMIEMMVAVVVMLIVTSAVVSLVKTSLSTAGATYELTDAQESLRTAQEYISRDLMNAGDGLKSVTYIPVNTTFVTNYLSLTPIADASMAAGVTNLGILTTDNDVPGTTIVPAPSPLPSPTSPIEYVSDRTDRQTILEIDPDPSNIQIVPTAIDANFKILTLPSGTDMTKFTVGEIYFLTSAKGGTFGAITNIDATNKQLTFGNSDYCGLNVSGTNGRIKDIATAGIPALQRMRIIQYYVDSNKLLKRRVFGDRGVAFHDSIIAEHVISVQFVYSLGLDINGNPVQPTSLLTTPAQQVAISAVEVTVKVETPHSLEKALQPLLSSTTSTSLRNMQFRQALQPIASPTP